MDYLRSVQTLAAVGVLLKMARQANSDGKITPSEWNNILAYGLYPIFALHGIAIAPPPATSMFAVEVRTEIDRSIANTAKMLGQ